MKESCPLPGERLFEQVLVHRVSTTLSRVLLKLCHERREIARGIRKQKLGEKMGQRECERTMVIGRSEIQQGTGASFKF